MRQKAKRGDMVAGAELFRDSVDKANNWLQELATRLGWDNPHHVYRALRVVLQLLRDRLPVNEAAQLPAEFPLVVKGIYWENWRPAKTPNKELDRIGFSNALQQAFPDMIDFDAESVCTAVFAVLQNHISRGEANDVGSNLPESLRTLWQASAA